MNSNIGYNTEEIKSSLNKDLIHLKQLVLSYLTNTSQKLKNCEYKILYKRIIDELKLRSVQKDLSKETNETKETNESAETDKLLGKKRESSACYSRSNFEIPNFLNDKEIILIKVENEKKQASSEDNKSLNSDSDSNNGKYESKANRKSNESKYLKGILFI